MVYSLNQLKKELARALDDNLHTRQWHNIVDWIIVTMILISSLEIFLSTFDVDPRLRRVLLWVDVITLIFFTIEVSLRIWVAPEINPKFKGWRGRLKYCFTFYGAIDVLSTFPFYLQWIFPLPVAAFKMLRTARVVRTFRIGRYSKSFSLLNNAIKEKRRELIVSMQFLLLITFILSLVLFFAEHEAQPDIYKNGFISVVWAFAQYIGDPGQFADTPPITGIGRIIACIVGLLGIAIVAVPAGIIGAGFTEALGKEARREEVSANIDKLKGAFQRKLDRPSGYQVVPPIQNMLQIQARAGLKAEAIFDIINESDKYRFRIINTASTIPVTKRPSDTLAVEHYMTNRSYGLCINRGSDVTIISPSSYIDAGVGNFAFYLALFGGFNYISREEGNRNEPTSFYMPPSGGIDADEYREYISDLKSLLSKPEAWSFTILASSGALEPELPTQFHLAAGGNKGEEIEIDPSYPLVTDMVTYREFFKVFTRRMNDEFSLSSDHQQYHSTSSPRLSLRHLGLDKTNNVILRIEWERLLWDPRRILICRETARCIADVIEQRELVEDPLLKIKGLGFDDYLNQYK